LDECNAHAKKIIEEQRANARIHGTPEHQYLTWMNTQVKIVRLWLRANADDSGGPKDWTPERLFPYQRHDPKDGTEKLNFVSTRSRCTGSCSFLITVSCVGATQAEEW